MRKRLFTLGALGCCIFAGAITTAPAAAQTASPTVRDGSFSCRASVLRAGPLEPITAGDNTATQDDRTDASDPCRPQASGLADYAGPTGCYGPQPLPNGTFDPNCFSPNQISLGLLYATTLECRPNLAPAAVDPPGPAGPGDQPVEGIPGRTDASGQPTGDQCSSTPGTVDLQSRPPAEGDGVKARAGAADLFLTDSSGTNPTQRPNFLHVSGVNSFAEVTCRTNPAAGQPGHNPNHPEGQRIPVWDARSQVVYIAGAFGTTFVGLDIVPGLIPGASPTTLNQYRNIGPIRFNVTYINDNEPGGPVGPQEGEPRQPVQGGSDLMLGGDADPFTAGFQPVYKVTQRAVDIGGAIVAGEATVDVTKNPCGPGGDPKKKGKIIVKKVTTPQPDATSFAFTVNPGNQAFNLSHGQTATFDNLADGTYTVTEAENTNYTQTSVCDDPTPAGTTAGGRTATVTLANGETVTCTFTNTKNGCPPGQKPKDGKCVPICPDGKSTHPCPKPPKCDRDHDGKDDRDKDGDGKDDRNGKKLPKGKDHNRNGVDDECERAKSRSKSKCSKHAKKSKKAAAKYGNKGSKDGCKSKKSKKAKRSKKNKR